jgi:hypothetical protein
MPVMAPYFYKGWKFNKSRNLHFLQALVTGSVPGFVDVVLNFGSAKYEGDSILAQMSQAGQRVVFYGDDTWIKLFSDHFTRSEGTTSFYVTDYTEVIYKVKGLYWIRYVYPSVAF